MTKQKIEWHFTSDNYTCKGGKFEHLLQKTIVKDQFICVFCGLKVVNPYEGDLK